MRLTYSSDPNELLGSLEFCTDIDIGGLLDPETIVRVIEMTCVELVNRHRSNATQGYAKAFEKMRMSQDIPAPPLVSKRTRRIQLD
jgi:hypothetical protein